MSRFANPDAIDRLSLGACECPGRPHDEDWIDLRTEIGAELFEALGIASNAGNAVGAYQQIIVGWNLLNEDGTEAEIDRPHVNALYASSFTKIVEWGEQHFHTAAVPNVPAVLSPSFSRESGSPRTRTRKKAA